MTVPDRLFIDGQRTRRVVARLRDLAHFPVEVHTHHGAVSGRMVYRDETLHLEPLDEQFPLAANPVDEPVGVRVCDVVAVVVLRTHPHGNEGPQVSGTQDATVTLEDDPDPNE